MKSHSLTRRELLAGAAVTLRAAAAADDPFRGDRLFRHVEEYAALGEHRSAGETDAKTSVWLADALAQAGLKTERRPFSLQQFFLKKVMLEVRGAAVEAFPMWWPKPTGPVPVRASLAKADAKPAPGSLKGRIAVVALPEVPGASLVRNCAVHQLIADQVKAEAAAVIGVSQVATGELMALNAQAGLDPWPLPVVIVGRKDEASLMAGADVSLLIDGHYNAQAKAFEVLGHLERGKRLVIVSTPYSGWFRCAGERGPGIAYWIALAHWAAARKSDSSYLFVASSGHELAGTGMHAFLEGMAPGPDRVAAWLHLGAGIATYDFKPKGAGIELLRTPSPMRRLYTVPEFATALRSAFARLPDITPVVTDQPGGEMILIGRKGYRVFGLAGGSAFHHMPGDSPRTITGPDILEPVGVALMRTLDALDRRT